MGQAIARPNPNKMFEDALINDTIAEKPKMIFQDDLAKILGNIGYIYNIINIAGIDKETKADLLSIRERLLNLVKTSNIVSQ